MIKAAYDRLFAFAALVFLSPIWLGTAIVLWITQRHVIFRQLRAGKNGEVFTIYKFKTMNDKRDASGNLLPDKHRMTRLGKLVRTYSIDELPQLFNVLFGNMSLVGPRPLYPEYIPLYSSYQATRLQVKPGITGLAQIKGRNQTTWRRRLKWDAVYVKNRSTSLDLWIICKTILSVISGKDVHAGDEITMPPFTGNTVIDQNP